METKKKIPNILNSVLIASIVIAVVAFIISVLYIFLIYLDPVFSDSNFNYLKAVSEPDIKPSSEIKYEISLKNTGFREVKDLFAVFHIPENTSFYSSSPSGNYIEKENVVVFEKELFSKDETEKMSVTLTADKPLDNSTIIKGAVLNLTYLIGSKEMEERFEDNSEFIITSSPDLKLSKVLLVDRNGGDLLMGDSLRVDFEIENIGDMNSKNLNVSAMIPEKTALVESSVSPKEYKIIDGNILWTFPVFEIEKKSSFSFNLDVSKGFEDGEEIIVAAAAESDEISVQKEQAEASVRLFPDLGNSSVLLKDADGEYLWAGDRLSVSAVIKNSGEREALGARLECPVPQYTSYINGTASCEGSKISFEDGVLIFEIDEIAMGEERQAVFDLQVAPSMTGGGSITTDFSLSSNGSKFEIENSEISIKANFKTTIVCMGDSLVARSDWPAILDGYLESRYPRADFNTIASGIGGELSWGGYARFDSSVAIYNPQIVIIGYGTNDTGGSQKNFSYYLNALVAKAKNIGATPMLESLGYINTSIAPEKVEWPIYQKIIYQVASANGVPVIDVQTPLSSNPRAYIADWVHYTPEGSKVVAQTVFNYVINYLDEYGRRK